MDTTSGEIVCLICFESIEKRIFVPSDGPAKIFTNCITYLHSTLTKETLQDIQLNNENQLPLCKSCFDSALELTQLSEQLTTVQKDISDLTVAFSMAVFHRRSQVYSLKQMQNNSQSFSDSSIVEFNEACLPPNLFSNKNENKNIHYHKSNNQSIVINSFHNPTDIILNVNSEIRDLQFANSPFSESSITNNDLITEIELSQKNLDQQWISPSIEGNGKNNASVSEMRIVHSNSIVGNESKSCAVGQNDVQLTAYDLLKSVKMPDIKLERVNIKSNEIDGKSLDVAPFIDDEVADPSYSPSTSGGVKPRKRFGCDKRVPRRRKRNNNPRPYIRGNGTSYTCSFCEKSFRARSSLEYHERTHTGERPFQCSFCENRFSFLYNLRRHEETHTGQKRFECSICKSRFRHSSSLKRHLSTHTHTGESNSLYGAATITNKIRKDIHQNSRPKNLPTFECSFCKHKCGSPSHLKLHENMHTDGVMNFKCSFCHITFATDKDKIVHEKTHSRAGEQNVENFIVGI